VINSFESRDGENTQKHRKRYQKTCSVIISVREDDHYFPFFLNLKKKKEQED
jgi:hypothetical protein